MKDNHFPSLKALLEVAKMSQTDLAKLLKISTSLVSQIVRGKTKPKRKYLSTMAYHLLAHTDTAPLESEDYMAKCLDIGTDDEILAKR